MAGSKTCPKCGGRMSEGFVVDADHGSNKVTQWAAGAPVRSFWTATKMRGVKLHEVVSWRCDKCHYLENYAPG